MSIVNFERDMFWTSVQDTVGFSASILSSEAVVCTTDLSVGQRSASLQTDGNTFTAASGLACLVSGCLILPPVAGDNVPYRVKGSAFVTGDNAVAYGFGYLNGGAGVTVSQVRFFVSGRCCDEAVLIPPLGEATPNFGDPLCFFVAVPRVSAASVRAALSVQRLVSKPDHYAIAVS